MDPKALILRDLARIMESVVMIGPSLLDRFVDEIEKFNPDNDNAAQVKALATIGVILIEKEARAIVAEMLKAELPAKPSFSVN